MPATYAPRPPAGRLTSLRDLGRSTPSYSPSPRPRPKPNNDCCASPDIQEMDGNRVCLSCGTVISESNIVSEITFGETSAGAAVVQGGFVGDGQRHARTMGTGFRRAGGGGSESREQTEYNGRDEIRKLAAVLNLSTAIEEQGFSVYKLALANNFIQGRRTRTVAAVCLYIACRRTAGNTTLLMDFAEKIQVNVFRLGEVYKDLVKELYIDLGEGLGIIEVEPLLLKFARKLEFGNATMQVATDAAKIVKRMKRDWMVEGRQPAGLCGACLILAARMNNFRRSVREVVYVVKVADSTILSRLEEFKRTQSSTLTVEQFRKYSGRLKTNIEPPSIYKAREKAEEAARRAAAAEEADEESTVVSVVDDADIPNDTQEGTANTGRKQVRFAASQEPAGEPVGSPVETPGATPQATQTSDGQAATPTPQPGDEQTGAPGRKRKAGSQDPKPKKKKRVKPPPPPPVADEDLEIEEDLENEMISILTDPDTLNKLDDAVYAASKARAIALADQLRQRREIPETQEIREDEFDSDPEIANCLLSAEEIVIKERIWVTMNEDWLRLQQAKMLKKTLEEASGGGKKKVIRRKSKGRMGDGSVLEGDTPVKDAADAALRMLQKRSKGNFSKYINYEKLQDVYGGNKVEYKGLTGGANTPATSRSVASPANGSAQGPASPAASEVEIDDDLYNLNVADQSRQQQQKSTPQSIGGEEEVIEEIIEDDTAIGEETIVEDDEDDDDEPDEQEDYDQAVDPMNYEEDFSYGGGDYDEYD